MANPSYGYDTLTDPLTGMPRQPAGGSSLYDSTFGAAPQTTTRSTGSGSLPNNGVGPAAAPLASSPASPAQAGTPPPTTTQATPGVSDAAKQAARTELMQNGFGGVEQNGAAKIDDTSHAADSPKYEFAQTAMNLGLTGKTADLQPLLTQLQQQDPAKWNGWSVNGGDLVYTGDPAKEDASFGGVMDVDAVLASHNGGNGFWWGANSPSGSAPSAAPAPAVGVPLTTMTPLPQAAAPPQTPSSPGSGEITPSYLTPATGTDAVSNFRRQVQQMAQGQQA